jgi:DNA-binding CsgD family transcriptional regulator/PAS domain-containing protein
MHLDDIETTALTPYAAHAEIELISPGEPDAQSLSSLVGAIYDAALEPGLWPTVLDRCRRFVGGMSANIFMKDVVARTGSLFHSDGRMGEDWQRAYFGTYARLDPLTGFHAVCQLGVPVATADLMDVDEFRQTRFYREWSAPQGIVDFIGAPIERRGASIACFGIFRHERDGMIDAASKERMALLVPHIRRAVAIGKVIETGMAKANSLGEAVDGLAAGVLFVDAVGRISYANAAATEMLGGSAVSKLGGRVIARNRDANKQLADVFAAASDGDAAVDKRGISILLPGDDGDDLVAHILPLTSGSRREAGTQFAAVAAMFIHRATRDVPSAPEMMARTFGLTLSELRVLDAIVHIGGVPETAEELGVAETTVKTHLHRVFAKTGTSRQADLVRLVAGYASPLVR